MQISQPMQNVISNEAEVTTCTHKLGGNFLNNFDSDWKLKLLNIKIPSQLNSSNS